MIMRITGIDRQTYKEHRGFYIVVNLLEDGFSIDYYEKENCYRINHNEKWYLSQKDDLKIVKFE